MPPTSPVIVREARPAGPVQRRPNLKSLFSGIILPGRLTTTSGHAEKISSGRGAGATESNGRLMHGTRATQQRAIVRTNTRLDCILSAFCALHGPDRGHGAHCGGGDRASLCDSLWRPTGRAAVRRTFEDPFCDTPHAAGGTTMAHKSAANPRNRLRLRGFRVRRSVIPYRDTQPPSRRTAFGANTLASGIKMIEISYLRFISQARYQLGRNIHAPLHHRSCNRCYLSTGRCGARFGPTASARRSDQAGQPVLEVPLRNRQQFRTF
jgi:hypothetical protein